MALSSTLQEAIWLKRLLADLHFSKSESITLYEDNQAAIALVNDHRFSERTKHVAIRYFFIRELISDGQFSVQYCPTENMIADIFTKALHRQAFEKLRDLFGLRNMTATTTSNKKDY